MAQDGRHSLTYFTPLEHQLLLRGCARASLACDLNANGKDASCLLTFSHLVRGIQLRRNSSDRFAIKKKKNHWSIQMFCSQFAINLLFVKQRI